MIEVLKDKKFLVVGGSSGLGFATAKCALERGARVTIASNDQEKLNRAAGQLADNVSTSLVDTRNEASVEAMFAAAGEFDHIVVSASSAKTGSVRRLPLADAYAAMDSKFWGAYRVARAARLAPGGSLTLISGMLGRRPSASSVLQGAINAALEGLVRGLALELAPVRVNAVSPGTIDTRVHSHLSADKRIAMIEDLQRRLPAGRIGQPEEVAQAILFLAANSYVTATVVAVDGGSLIA